MNKDWLQESIYMQEMDAANEQIEQEQEKVLVIEKWEKEKDGRVSHKIMGEVTPCKNVGTVDTTS